MKVRQMTSEERKEARYQRRKAKREGKLSEINQECTFEKVFSFSHLYHSYRMCCKGVGWKKSTQAYRANAILNVAKAYWSLRDGSFRSKGFFEFDIFERGKPRHIRAVHISERVIQRCLCDYALVPLLQRSFIYDNGASMKGKGISFALDRMEEHLKEYYRRYGTEGYILTFDMHHYFDSIPHELVFRILDRAVADEKVRNLAKYFVRQFGDVGLGLGSQVSQICALAALNGLDHRIKEMARIPFYGRYMDDGYLICPDKEYLNRCRKAVIRYCRGMGLQLNDNKTQIKPVRSGVRFLKIRFILTEKGGVIRLVNRKNVVRMRRKLKIFREWARDPENRFTAEDAETSYASWKGHVKHCNSWRTRQEMQKLYRKLFLEMEVQEERCTVS